MRIATEAAPGEGHHSLWKRVAPIVFFQLYLNASILLFAFGPWVWPIPDGTRLYTFVALAHVALLAGYLTACFRAPRAYHGPVSGERVWRWSVLLTLLLFLPTVQQLTSGVGLGVMQAITDPGSVYMQYQLMVESGSGSGGIGMVTYVRILLAPVLAASPALVARYWRGSTALMRVLGALAILSNVSLFVFTGRNKGLVDLVLLLPWMFAIYMAANRVRLGPGRLVVGTALFLAALVGFSEFYARGNEGRAGGAATNIYWVRLLGGMEADADHWLLRGRSVETQAMILGLGMNQTHGYYALSLALEKPWEPTYGLGHGYFLHGLEQRFLETDGLRRHSYPGRLEMENGWSYTEFWHTFYTWVASDVSFPGTLLVVFLLGRLFALVWVDTLRGDNPFAIGLFLILVTMLYYFPTNNIVLGFLESWVGFWSLVGLWWLTRRPVRLRAGAWTGGAAAPPPPRPAAAGAGD